jgi:hypothetical protein
MLRAAPRELRLAAAAPTGKVASVVEIVVLRFAELLVGLLVALLRSTPS